ncbi:MAG: hypothetical protein IT239_05115 [Bacteroidia bacterium]|nr:hypothetical protein [Bacteroidia bacterium]
MKKYAYILFIAITFLGCKKSTIELPPDFGYDYFPNEVGRYNTYQVDSIVYNLPFNKIDTFRFQVKELQESTYKDSEEKESIRLVHFYRSNASATWVIKNVWAQRLSVNKAERQEENIRLTKLVFPLKKNTEWNINASNTLDKQNAKVLEYDAEFELDGKDYTKACLINVVTDTNLIDYKKHREVYVRGVGLLYSEYYDLQSNQIIANKPSVLQRIETGVICKRKLIDYGKQ